MKGVGERLSKLRKARKLTQEEAAKKMEIVRSTYSNYESGKREPDLDTLKKMADFYKVSVNDLLGTINNDQAKSDALRDAIARLSDSKKKVVTDLVKELLDE